MRRLLLGLVLASAAIVPATAFAQGYGPYPYRGYYGYRGYPPYGYRYGYYRPPVVPYYAPAPYPVYGPPVYGPPAYPPPGYGYGVGVGIATPGFGLQFGS